MIESAIKTALERITGMAAYPLLLPDTVQAGVTFQRISDPGIYAGLLRTGLIAGRFQISLYLLDSYTDLLRLDRKIWSEWKQIVHGQLDGFPVQYVDLGGIHQDKTTLTNGRNQYRLVRDFTFVYPESAE
ncbi:hypothetical protein AB6K26_004284 [Salmonella enterica]